MSVAFNKNLTDLAASILCDAARVYSRSDAKTWLSGYNPVLTAWDSCMFGSLEMTGSFQVTGEQNGNIGHATLKRLFRLPGKLPAVRLPPASELAALARSAPLMVKLEELARWLGSNGRFVNRDGVLHDADADDAAHWLGVEPTQFPYLWEHALVSGWFEMVDDPASHRSWVVVGKAAHHWAEGDVWGVLHVWATVFASVLATTLEVAAGQAPGAARRLNFQGQGVALAVVLFLARRTGVTKADVRDIVRDSAIGDPSTRRARKSWDAWVREFGDPAHRLLGELAAARALVLPSQDDGILTLSPLAQWALREQFMLDNISIRVIPASGELSAADLVELTDAVSDAEFNAECRAWFSRRPPTLAARDLLMYAAQANAQARLTAVNLARRIGLAARGVWLDFMERPQLRGYARIALRMMAADLPESDLTLIRNTGPDDLYWVAADLLSLLGRDDDPCPEKVAMQFAEVVPAGQEKWVLGLLAGGSHPDSGRVLALLGRSHPDRAIAKDARKAARVAAKNRLSAEY
jgi:hypothetical protein